MLKDLETLYVYLYSSFKSFGRNSGYYGNFGTAAALFLLAIGIAQMKIRDKKEKKKEKVRVFDWRNVVESFKVLVKKRPNKLGLSWAKLSSNWNWDFVILDLRF